MLLSKQRTSKYTVVYLSLIWY